MKRSLASPFMPGQTSLKKFYEEKCTLSFTKWQITLCVLELQGGKYKFGLHSRLGTPNPSDLRGRDVWGCSDKLPFHITGLSHKYLCRIWQGYYFLVVKRTAICDEVCSTFLDTALHEFLLWILLREYMSLEFTESKPQDKVLPFIFV